MRIGTRLSVALVTLASATLFTTTPAHAYAGALFPTQNSGNRRTDVLAIQHLLAHHGQATALTSVFDSSTVTKVKAFQSAKGLGSDGIAGPATWGALVPLIQQGSSAGNAVKALQVQLNAKRNLSLSVDGVFSATVTTAVRNFQSHAGIGVDGIAARSPGIASCGTTTIRR